MRHVALLSLMSMVMALAMGVGAVASAAIIGTFVPAVDGVNSFQSSDGVSDFSSTTATAGLWHDRPGTFDIVGLASPQSGAYQGQNKTGGAQTHNEVVTTITGLDVGSMYSIDIVYGINPAASSGSQDIDAGFASGSLTTLTEAGGTLTGDNLMASGWVAAQQNIGTAIADSNGEIKVYVGATLNAERSVYNGLAYVPVPEPTGITLLAICLGGAAVSLRRKPDL
ncbi:hypothetical protein NG895_23875 [Aeoliella sp. ICT_H6.2]|uniref:PEP-CTERM protein-sorting domain-containing protein n=1 Tax=Aeoliella straminimaris TaxID=2954799 RepID=A0A9X2JKN5_9BACT|nr:hypothetical protein [Aeoliella straminimaris]MCO6046949.1 hypothetical protein [Aeoliella straminimaris]